MAASASSVAIGRGRRASPSVAGHAGGPSGSAGGSLAHPDGTVSESQRIDSWTMTPRAFGHAPNRDAFDRSLQLIDIDLEAS